MRVLMTSDAVGGVWQYALQLAELLTSRHHEVVLATMGPLPSPAQQLEARAIPGLSLRSSSFALEWMADAWDDVERAATWLLELEDDCGADLVHLNGYAHASLPWRAPTVVVAHSDVWSWWEAVHGRRPPDEWKEYVQRVTKGLLASTSVVAPTMAVAEALPRLYGVDRHVTVIPNVRMREWRPAPKKSYVFAAGRAWDQAKNISALEKIGAELPWPVYVAGDTAGPGAQSREFTTVRRLGRLALPDIRKWMGEAAIYALPARYEPFGLSVLEAAMSGCALVLGDIDTLRENWDGVACFVHPDQTDELRGTIRNLIDHPAERERLGAAARQRADAFDPIAHVAAYEGLYRELVNGHGRTTHSPRAL